MKNHIDVRKLSFYVVPKKLKDSQLTVDKDQVVQGLSNFLKAHIDEVKNGDLTKGYVYAFGSDNSLAYVGTVNISVNDNDKVSYEWTKQEELPSEFTPYDNIDSSDSTEDSNDGVEDESEGETSEKEDKSSEEERNTSDGTGNVDDESDKSDTETSTNKTKSDSEKKSKEDDSSDEEASEEVTTKETDKTNSKSEETESNDDEENIKESALIVEAFLDYYAEQALSYCDTELFESIYEDSAILASLYLEGLFEDVIGQKPLQITKDKYLDAKKNWDDVRHDPLDELSDEQTSYNNNSLRSSAISLYKAEKDYNDSEIHFNSEKEIAYRRCKESARLKKKSNSALIQALDGQVISTGNIPSNTTRSIQELCNIIESTMITYEADCEKLVVEGVIDETIFENSAYLLSGFVCDAFGRTLECPDWYVKENTVENFLENDLPDALKPYSESFLMEFKRSELPDTSFGVPSQRKFPLVDRKHVESAIKLFHHVDPEYEEELANNIIDKMKEYDMFGVCKIHNKEFEKYLVKKDSELKEKFDITGFPVATEFNISAMHPTHGLAFYNRQRPLNDFRDGIDSTDEFEKLQKKDLKYIKSPDTSNGLYESVMDEELGVMYEAVDKKTLNEIKKQLSIFESTHKDITPFKRLRKRKVSPKNNEIKREIHNAKFSKCVDYIDPNSGGRIMRCYFFANNEKGKVEYKIISAPAKGKITSTVLEYYSNALELSIDKENINMVKAKALSSINGKLIKESVGFITESKLVDKIKQDIGYSKVIKAYEKENPGITKLNKMNKTHVMDNGKIYDNIDKSISDKVTSVIKSCGIKNIDDAWVYRYKNGKLFALALTANPNDKLITRIFFIENIPSELKTYYKAVFYNKTDCIPTEVVRWKNNYYKKLKAVKESVAKYYQETSMDIILEGMLMNDIKFDGVLRLFEEIHPDITRFSSLIQTNIPVSELDKYDDIIKPEVRRAATNATKFSYASKDYIVGVHIKGHSEPIYYFVGDGIDNDIKMYYLAAVYNNSQNVPEELVKWRAEITSGAQELVGESTNLYELFETGILKNITVPVSGDYEDFVDVYYTESITDIEAGSVLYDSIDYCATESVEIDKSFLYVISDMDDSISNQFDKYCESATTLNLDKKVFTTKLSSEAFNLSELTNKFEDMGFNITDSTTNCVILELIKGDKIYRAYIDIANKKITVTLDRMDIHNTVECDNNDPYKELEQIEIKHDDKMMCIESSYIDTESDNVLKNYYYTLENSNAHNLYKLSVSAYNHLTDKQKALLESTFTRVDMIEPVFTEKFASERKLINDTRKAVSKINVEHLNYRKYYDNIMTAIDKLERSGEKSVGTKNKIKLSVIKKNAEDTFESINNILGDKSIDAFKREIELQLKVNKRKNDIKSSVISVGKFKRVVKLSEKLFNYDEKCSEYLKYLNSIKVKPVSETTEDTDKVFNIIFEYKDEYGVTYESYDKYRLNEAYSAYLENEELFDEAVKDKLANGVKGIGKGAKHVTKSVGNAAVGAAKITGNAALSAGKAIAKVPIEGVKATGQYIKDGNTMLYFITGKDENGNEIVGKCTVAEYKRMNPKAKRRIDSYEKIDKYRYNKIKTEINKRRKDDKKRIKHADKLSKIDKSKHDVKVAYEAKGIDTSEVDMKYDERDRQRLVANISKVNINKLVDTCKKLELDYNNLRSHGIKVSDVNIGKIKRAVKKINKKCGKNPIIFINRMKTDMPIKELARFEKLVVDTDHTLEEYFKKLEYIKINHKKDLKAVSDDKVISDNVKTIKEFVEDYGVEDFEYIIEAKKDIDDDIKSLIVKLNSKGYKTKASCSGHVNTRIKEDTYRDGEYNGKLYTTARIVFDGKYDLPNAPSLWETRDAGGNSAIYVKQKHLNDSDGAPNDAFDKWKVLYMNSLKKWIDRLPNISKK